MEVRAKRRIKRGHKLAHHNNTNPKSRPHPGCLKIRQALFDRKKVTTLAVDAARDRRETNTVNKTIHAVVYVMEDGNPLRTAGRGEGRGSRGDEGL